MARVGLCVRPPMSRASSYLVVAALAVGMWTGALIERQQAKREPTPNDVSIVEHHQHGPLLSISWAEGESCESSQPDPDPDPDPDSDPTPAVDAVMPANDAKSCRARYAHATDIDVASPPLETDGIVTSAWDVRLLAVHDGQAVMLSRDEGRTWQAVFVDETRQRDGGDARDERESPNVLDVAFDCGARLHVLRTDGSLGTYDLAADTQSWDAVHVLEGAEMGRLLVDRLDVAILGPDPARADQLILVRHDEVLDWSPKAVFADNDDGSWDGVEISAIKSRGRGRFKVWLTPWNGGECGWGGFAELYVNTRTGGARSVSKGDESEEHPGWPTDDGGVATDAAGRVVVVEREDEASTLARMTRAEYEASLARESE